MRKRRPSIRDVRNDLQALLDDEGLPREDQLYQEMLINIAQLRLERLDTGDLRLMHTAARELRHALTVFKRYRNIPKVAVFGSARTPKHDPDYRLARAFGREMARKGWMVITGGASGIMEAALVGAGVKHSWGLNIVLPFEQHSNSVIEGNRKLMYFKYFFTRKLMFLKESSATVLFPGGFGTWDEGFESFTLVQTGKARPRPILLMDPHGNTYWRAFLHMVNRQMLRKNFISKDDLKLIKHAQTVGPAVREILHFYSNYHSSRFIKSDYLIRLNQRLSAKHLGEVQKRFGYILKRGHFELMKDFSSDDNQDAKLERLIFPFNKANYAGLRLLIDYLNKLR